MASGVAHSKNEVTVVIGARSKIAQALIRQIRERPAEHVIAVSRSAENTGAMFSNVEWLQSDYSEQSIGAVCQQLKARELRPTRVVICNGLLHSNTAFPEKQVREFSEAQWWEVMRANTLVPMLWLQGLAKTIPSRQTTQIVVFSARVGSITDNRLGGWYSYRSSKAALNMLVKTVAIEMKRTHPNVSLVLFHPGTTDTPLSKPFQQRVPKEQLFSADFVATQLLKVLEQRTEPMPLEYLDWAGETIEF